MKYKVLTLDKSKGKKLSENFWEKYLFENIRKYDIILLNDLTAGLFSEGSECFGFDDDLSQDHDYGNSIILCVKDKSKKEHLNSIINNIFVQNPNMKKGRINIYTNDEYFLKFTSFRQAPQDIKSWLKIPLNYLSTMANGFIFFNTNKEFIKTRQEFLNLPADIVLKHISYRLIMAGKSGQYNLKRSLQRKDIVSAQIFKSEFIKNYMELMCLLNLYIPPYDKWLYKTTQLILSNKEIENLRQLANIDIDKKAKETVELVENMATPIVKALNSMNITSVKDDFLVNSGLDMFEKIKDKNILSLGPWYEVK